MFESWIRPFLLEASGEAAMNHVRVISNYHRIQASPGYRAAAGYVHGQLEAFGLQSEIIRYPADPNILFGNYRSFREWTPREAELEMIYPERKRLARFTEVEISLIQRSTATPVSGIEGELVHVPDAEAIESYENIDVRGKWVLAQGDQMRIHELAVVRNGAIGLVMDNMTQFPPIRSRLDMVDAVQYTSFWWHGEEKTGLGFAVSPRVGDELRKACQHGPVRLRGRVDADLAVGEFENIEAFIPGETEEEVLLVSHLCHPKPGANDNASGPSTLLETARILQRLILGGEIPRPRRGLRFLMIPEMTGTHAYVQMHPDRIKKTVAALNLDMVGANLKLSGGPLTIEKSSRALPSYTAELAYGIFNEVAQDITNFSGTFGYSLTPHIQTPFSGGSDHYILADPTVGIPCPMMITWPDKFYHTTMDTVDHIDPELMRKVAITSAAYMMWIANAGVEETLQLSHRMALQFASDIDTVRLSSTRHGWNAERALKQLAFLKERKEADLRSITRLIPQEDLDRWEKGMEGQLRLVQALHDHAHLEGFTQNNGINGAESESEVAAASTIPSQEWDRVWKQASPGPIDIKGFMDPLTVEEREQWFWLVKRTPHTHTGMTLLGYWMDGKRALREVVDAVELEIGWREEAFTLAYIQLLERLGLIQEAI
jgi:aminopeptidase YwaD